MMKTPVTDMVREGVDDYLVDVYNYLDAVERLEVVHRQVVEAATQAWEALHQFHPPQERIPIGKGLCQWRPCKELREAIKAAKEASDVED